MDAPQRRPVPDVGRDRRAALRPRLPARLPADRQPARRRGPHPGGLRPGVPLRCRPTHPARSRAGCTGSPPTSSSTRPAASSGSASTRCPTSAPSRLTSSRARRPDAAYADRTFDDDVERALATLPPDFRAAVVLCDVEGLTYEEIADILGAKLGTVRSRIHRGRAMLRTALAHRAPQPGRLALLRPVDRTVSTGGRPRDRTPRRPGQRPARRPAVPERDRAGLGARARLPRLPRPGRARGLGQDPARRPLLRGRPRRPDHLKGSLLGAAPARPRRAPGSPRHDGRRRAASGWSPWVAAPSALP